MLLTACLILSTNFSACQQENDSPESLQFISVTGPVFSSDMGRTLIHEHVLVDWIGADSTGYHRWNREEVIEKVLPYLLEASEKGVETIMECTPAYLGRDPLILRELSSRSGVQILTNTGYYGAVENKFMPRHTWEESAEQIAQRWINEFEHGIEDTGIRPGFIKISVKGEGPLSDLHQKIVHAAALAHLETGMIITSHTTGDEPAFAQIELLKEFGVSPSAWVWTHSQSGSLKAQLKAGREGAWISLDNFNYDSSREAGEKGNLDWFIQRINELKEAKLLHRVLISHDAGYYNPDEQDGGDFRNYTEVFEYLLPSLRENGFTEKDINQILVQNPEEAYGIRVRAVPVTHLGEHNVTD